MADCGCTPGIELTNPGGAKTFITYCPKHDAVDDLIAALNDIEGKTHSGSVSAVLGAIQLIAQDAIRKSQIPPESGAKG